MKAKIALPALLALLAGCAAAPPPEVWVIYQGDGAAAPVLGIPAGRGVRVFQVSREPLPGSVLTLRDARRR